MVSSVVSNKSIIGQYPALLHSYVTAIAQGHDLYDPNS